MNRQTRADTARVLEQPVLQHTTTLTPSDARRSGMFSYPCFRPAPQSAASLRPNWRIRLISCSLPTSLERRRARPVALDARGNQTPVAKGAAQGAASSQTPRTVQGAALRFSRLLSSAAPREAARRRARGADGRGGNWDIVKKCLTAGDGRVRVGDDGRRRGVCRAASQHRARTLDRAHRRAGKRRELRWLEVRASGMARSQSSVDPTGRPQKASGQRRK